MFWIPMHTDMAKFTDKKNRAKEISLIEATTLAMSVAGPVVAGWILAEYDYDVLFVIGILVYLISLIPLSTLPKTKERYSWSYKKTWKEFVSPRRRKTILAFMGDGAEGVVGLIIWPIFIFELLQGSYFEVGAISSLVVLVSVIFQLLIGKFADAGDKKRMIKWGSVLYAFGWIAKIFIITAFQIFIASTYHSFAKIFARTPFETMLYERAADQGHYVDEYTVIHEMAIQLGKSLMLVFAFILIMFLEIQWVFALAALASLAMNYLSDENVIQSGRHAG
jgi:MFS family permease